MLRFLSRQSSLFPLALFAFAGVAVSYVNTVFNANTRWLVLIVLFVRLLFAGKLFNCLRGWFGIILLANILWCLLTSFWSEVPELTVTKALAFAGMALAVTSGGIDWASTRRSTAVINGLFPLTLIAIFAGLFGYTTPESNWDTGHYQGLTGNPNMLGSLAAMGFPFALWRFYSASRPGAARRSYWASAGMLVAILIIAIYAVARASILTMGCILICYYLAQRRGRQATYLITTTIIVVGISFAAPDIAQVISDHYIYKGGSKSVGILFSRERVWNDSYKNALKGGWIGGGYGVTIGERVFAGGFTAVGYGREKGNSPLAIMEELGFVGLGLYTALLSVLLVYLTRTFKRIQTREEKIAFGIVTGAIIGMVVNSIFEAWWVAPGSAEAPYFWGLVGISLGLERLAVGSLDPLRSPLRRSLPSTKADYTMSRMR